MIWKYQQAIQRHSKHQQLFKMNVPKHRKEAQKTKKASSSDSSSAARLSSAAAAAADIRADSLLSNLSISDHYLKSAAEEDVSDSSFVIK